MKSCSFFGHRNTVATPELCERLRQTIIGLIQEKNVKRFLFGSASAFDDLCLETVTELQKDYPKTRLAYEYALRKSKNGLKTVVNIYI